MYSWSSPAIWSFGSGNRVDELKGSTSYYTPGPGTYEEIEGEIYKKEYPSWKVGTSNRPDLYSSWNQNIGPGSYEVNKKQNRKHPKKTFSQSKKDSSDKKGTNPVGPGSYFPKKSTQAPPSFSFGYKTDGFIQLGSAADAPGPGTYDIKNVIDEAFTKSRRSPDARSAFTRTAPEAMTRSKENNKAMTPGPGHHYNADTETYDMRFFTPTWSFGKSNRDDLYNDEAKHVPGPGNYPIQSALNTRTGFTILGKNQRRGNTSETPAPDRYSPKIDFLAKTAPSFRIGKAARKDLAVTNDVPGPDRYNINELGPAKGTRIGTSLRPGDRPKHVSSPGPTPGPGQYEAEGTLGGNAKYSMGIKNQAKKASDVMPGPGEYEPHASVYLEKNIGAIIGTSERPPLYKKGGAPGPGQYDVRGNIAGDSWKIGSSKRRPLAKANDEPGPGFYNIPSSIGNVPKYQKPGFAQDKRKTKMAEKEGSMQRF